MLIFLVLAYLLGSLLTFIGLMLEYTRRDRVFIMVTSTLWPVILPITAAANILDLGRVW